MPHFAMQTYGDQMAFLRVIEQLGTLDRLPLPSGDGVPDLDVDAPLSYVGLSMGSVHGSGFLPYAPEIKGVPVLSYSGSGFSVDWKTKFLDFAMSLGSVSISSWSCRIGAPPARKQRATYSEQNIALGFLESLGRLQ